MTIDSFDAFIDRKPDANFIDPTHLRNLIYLTALFPV
jgi:hypothetical protein